MADYRRHLAGRLWYAFLVRQPLERDLVGGEPPGAWVGDPWLRDHLHALVDRALLPDLLGRCLDSTADEPIDPGEHERAATVGGLFIALERERDEALLAGSENARPPRLREDWLRVTRRTAGMLRRRLRRAARRR